MGTVPILIAVGVFGAFLLLKSRIPLFRDPALVRARKSIAAAKQEARRSRGPKRASAFRRAATLALEDLGRPALAASFARRADKADPTSPENVRLLARAMRSAERHRALERLLWRRLDEASIDSERGNRIFQELLGLYEGPLRSRAQARVLRALKGYPPQPRQEEE
ncbi:MAG: hypothetical protein AAGE52_35790 [Myxococcota bacterium]